MQQCKQTFKNTLVKKAVVSVVRKLADFNWNTF